jgi:hypothetical protein
MCYFQKLPIPPGKFFRGLPITSDTLLQICQWVAITSDPCNKFAIGLPTTYGTWARDFPNWAQKDTLSAIPLQKVKIKIKNQKQK